MLTCVPYNPDSVWPVVPAYLTPLPVRLLEAVAESSLATSRGQARQLIADGAIFVNGERCQDLGRLLDRADLIHFRTAPAYVDLATRNRRHVVFLLEAEHAPVTT